LHRKFYDQLRERDAAFAATPEFSAHGFGLRTENDDLYDPDYTDVLRVAFTSEFERGRLSDLVSLLSGRNFETKSFDEAIAEKSFAQLRAGVDQFSNETNFKRFVMILRSAGFVDAGLIRLYERSELRLHRLSQASPAWRFSREHRDCRAPMVRDEHPDRALQRLADNGF